MEAQAAVYLTAKQNGKILQDKSLFTYTKYKVRGSSVYYYCSKKTVYNCKVTAKVDLSMEPNMITQINGEHEHDSDLLKVQVKALEKEAVEKYGCAKNCFKKSLQQYCGYNFTRWF